MEYVPPPTWPPPPNWPPPCDDWQPARAGAKGGWPLSPDGSIVLLQEPGTPARSHIRTPEDAEAVKRAVATRMVAMWAETVMSSAHSYYQAAMKAVWTDRAIEHAEDWSPPLDSLTRALEQVWVRGYQLVTAAYQMERWRQAYEGKANKDDVEHLQALRNSLEHLDGARFTEYSAHKGTGKNNAFSIEYLPGKELFLGFHYSYTEAAFGVVNLEEITQRARPYLYIHRPPEVEPDFDAMDWPDYEEEEIDEDGTGDTAHDEA